jgi:hypothetical protein
MCIHFNLINSLVGYKGTWADEDFACCPGGYTRAKSYYNRHPVSLNFCLQNAYVFAYKNQLFIGWYI